MSRDVNLGTPGATDSNNIEPKALSSPSKFRGERRREFRYHVSVACAVVLSWIVWLMPERMRNWVADRGGDFFFRFSPTYRRNVMANIAQVMRSPEDSKEVFDASRRVFRASGRNFTDLLLSPHMNTRRMAVDAEMVSGDWSILDEALERG